MYGLRFTSRQAIIVTALCLSLGGCSTLDTGGNSQLLEALQAMASDPNCGHTDRISGNLGGLSGNNLNIFLERQCPARPDGTIPTIP